MKWLEKTKNLHLSAPYQVVRNLHGWDAYIYSKRHSGVLGRRMTLDRAKALCEEHKAKEVNM
jgi:hypothetical protein